MTDETAHREALVHAARTLNQSGLNQGTSGNLSMRMGARMLITPTSRDYETLAPGDIADMAIADPSGSDWAGPYPPSSEWQLHQAILRARPDLHAVVHAHPRHATALSMLRQDIPPCHYMIAAFGGGDIRCAPYATFGTMALAEHAVAALEGRFGCLLANHGAVVCASSLDRAMWLMTEMEALAAQYCVAMQVGRAALLTDREITDSSLKIGKYGKL